MYDRLWTFFTSPTHAARLIQDVRHAVPAAPQRDPRRVLRDPERIETLLPDPHRTSPTTGWRDPAKSAETRAATGALCR